MKSIRNNLGTLVLGLTSLLYSTSCTSTAELQKPPQPQRNVFLSPAEGAAVRGSSDISPYGKYGFVIKTGGSKIVEFGIDGKPVRYGRWENNGEAFIVPLETVADGKHTAYVRLEGDPVTYVRKHTLDTQPPTITYIANRWFEIKDSGSGVGDVWLQRQLPRSPPEILRKGYRVIEIGDGRRRISIDIDLNLEGIVLRAADRTNGLGNAAFVNVLEQIND